MEFSLQTYHRIHLYSIKIFQTKFCITNPGLSEGISKFKQDCVDVNHNVANDDRAQDKSLCRLQMYNPQMYLFTSGKVIYYLPLETLIISSVS